MQTTNVIYEIQSDIEAMEKNLALYEETNFVSRVKAIDYIEFNVIERIEGLLPATSQPEELTTLKQYAENIKSQLNRLCEIRRTVLSLPIDCGLTVHSDKCLA